MTTSPYAGAIFLLAAQPTDRALTGWHLHPGDFGEPLAELGITYDQLEHYAGGDAA